MTRSYLTYEEFGAAGDGFQDDLPAIVRCHEEANRLRLPVRAKDGAVYYLGKRALAARIMTDVDFGTARFIIDDREPEDLTKYVFEIVPEKEPFFPEILTIPSLVIYRYHETIPLSTLYQMQKRPRKNIPGSFAYL